MLILADEDREDRPLDSDAHNLATLMLIRDHRARIGKAEAQKHARRAARQKEREKVRPSVRGAAKPQTLKLYGCTDNRHTLNTQSTPPHLLTRSPTRPHLPTRPPTYLPTNPPTRPPTHRGIGRKPTCASGRSSSRSNGYIRRRNANGSSRRRSKHTN